LLRYKEIFLGKRCNNKCLYCPYRQKDFSQPDFNSVTTALKRGEEDGVAFYGGEPTQRNDLAGIILAAKQNGYRRIKLITNGRAFSDTQVLFQIVNGGCNLFEMKLWGSHPDLHDHLTQTPGSFLQTIQGLENLQRLPCDKYICLRVPLCKQNYTDMINIITTGINLGVHRIILPFQDNNLALKDLLPYIKIAIQISILNRIWILTEGLPFCVMQGLEHHIGEIYYRYDNTINPRTYKHHKYCQNCIYQGICPGAEVEYLNQFGDREFSPIKVSKYFEDIKALYG
jgi:MoaA/NifB/PqqE/SkfB family radical SAM enzyme